MHLTQTFNTRCYSLIFLNIKRHGYGADVDVNDDCENDYDVMISHIILSKLMLSIILTDVKYHKYVKNVHTVCAYKY